MSFSSIAKIGRGYLASLRGRFGHRWRAQSVSDAKDNPVYMEFHGLYSILLPNAKPMSGSRQDTD